MQWPLLLRGVLLLLILLLLLLLQLLLLLLLRLLPLLLLLLLLPLPLLLRQRLQLLRPLLLLRGACRPYCRCYYRPPLPETRLPREKIPSAS